MEPTAPHVVVLAPDLLLPVTVEVSTELDSPEIHVHAGGQGLWLARMARSLGATVTACASVGGETGTVVAHLAREEGIGLRTTPGPPTGAYVHDRRGGERLELARQPSRTLDRHVVDDLYGTFLVASLDSDACVLTGTRDPTLAPDVLGRLARDLRAADRTVVADLSGTQARAVADVEGIVLKMSHEELVDGGFAADPSLPALAAAARGLVADGLGALVVSRAGEPALLVAADTSFLVTTPPMTTVDHRGAGDSMTAGIAVGLARGEPLAEAVRLGAAAGALNVTRHGLGTGRREQVERWASEIRIDPLTG